jgi:hypothetical protein
MLERVDRMKWKRCIRCGEYKPETEFNWRDEKKGYHQSVCRACQQEQGRERYADNPERVKAVNKSARQKMINEAQYFVYDFLSHSVCQDCGEYDFTVLTFHHSSGKKRMNISDMAAQGYTIEAIREEITNTIVLCWNCHMRREAEERSGGRFRRFWPKWPWE